MRWTIKRYNNYHKHTHYSNISTPDCVAKPVDYINRAKELGQDIYFTTEHGWQGNVFEAQTLCEQNGMKCVYGVEAYYVDDRLNRESRIMSHIILIAMTKKGQKDINRILSLANTDGYYYRPRIDLELLLSLNREDAVVTSACVASRLNKEGWFEDFFLPVRSHFKEHFFLEVQPHNVQIQKTFNRKLVALSRKYNVQLIHANDSHYINPKDSEYRDMFLLGKDIRYDDENDFILDYPSYDEIVQRYIKQGVLSERDIFQAIDNTLIFDDAEPIKYDREFKIPKIVDGDQNQALREMVYDNFENYKKEIDGESLSEYEKEIEYELNIIKDCNMASYFILNHLGIRKAVSEYNAVLTKSGRGSAGSFLVNKLLGLTEIDRLKSPITLYPTRFMSAERILQSGNMPDVDINSSSADPLIQAFKDILGEDNIYYMVAYKTLQDSSAFRLTCKAKGLHIGEYNEISKNLDAYKDKEQWRELYQLSQNYVGVIESIAPSPCSFLLLDRPISEEVGLIKINNVVCCCMDKFNCDYFKYVKDDFLTVTVYDLINKVYRLIGRPIDKTSDLIKKCSGNDKVWAIYEKGLTTTINQADSDYATHLLMRYKPKTLAELSAFVAAIRPGFASLLDNFIERKPYTTHVKELDSLLKESFHYMLYQESIMKYLVWLGIEEKETYDIIKKISKKTFTDKEMSDLKDKLKIGWQDKTGSMQYFDETWQIIEDAARYSFNASHALCVAIDSLYGAYLKAEYPLEYYTVALSIYENDLDRTSKMIKELSYFGISFKKIEFGKSGAEYLMDRKENAIYKGLGSIKYLNRTVAQELFDISRSHTFKNFLDVLKVLKNESRINSRQLEILIELDFFKKYGNVGELLYINKMFNFFRQGNVMTISKRKVQEINDLYSPQFETILKEYATDIGKSDNILKSYRISDSTELMNRFYREIMSRGISDYTIKEKMKVQQEYLGYIDLTTNRYQDRQKLIVLDVKPMKNRKSVWAYAIQTQSIGSGKKSSLTVYSRLYEKQPLNRHDVIFAENVYKNSRGYWYLSKYEKIGDDTECI